MNRKTFLGTAVRWMAAGAMAWTAGAAQASDGVSDSAIVLGMSTPLTGTAGTYGQQMKEGIEAFFSRTNAAGGVHGRTLQLRTIDDGYETSAAMRNTRQLIEKDKVFALMGFYGTASTQAVMPIIEAARVPLVGTVSGAGVLRQTDNRHVFHIRASYDDETAAIVRNLSTVGITRVAVFYQDDGFGLAGLAGVRAALEREGAEPVATGSVPRNSTEVATAVSTIAKSKAQAVVMVALAQPAAAFVRAMRARGAAPYFVALSPVGTDQLIAELGVEHTRGIQVSQVIPNPRLDKLALVREYKEALARHDPKAQVSYYGLEGYMAAKLMVAALERAGRAPTRDSVTAALRSAPFDLGGYRVRYAQAGNAGSSYVEISVVGVGGKILN